MNRRQLLGLVLILSPLIVISVAAWIFAPDERWFVLAIWGFIVSLVVVIVGALLLFLGGDYE